MSQVRGSGDVILQSRPACLKSCGRLVEISTAHDSSIFRVVTDLEVLMLGVLRRGVRRLAQRI